MGVTDPSLDGIAGMLFVFDDDTTTGFWMKDTLIPLSIAFADQQRNGDVHGRHGPLPGWHRPVSPHQAPGGLPAGH